MVRAVAEGFRRTASAPAVLAGTFAATLVFAGPPVFRVAFLATWHYLTVLSTALDLLAVAWISSLLNPVSGADLLGHGEPIKVMQPMWLVLWSFLAGGVLDRYARNRPTRGRGFFGACGAHFPAMLRLSVGQWLIDAAVGLGVVRPASGLGVVLTGLLVLLGVHMIVLYARVRIVVEDRRSAAGAVLSAARFVRRNAVAAVTLYVAFAGVVLFPWLAGFSDYAVGAGYGRTAFMAVELAIALHLFIGLALLASATALFQSRLAHASYTAGPPLEWPESAAAEAIANAAQRRIR